MASHATPHDSPWKSRLRQTWSRCKSRVCTDIPAYLKQLYIRFRDDDIQGLAAEMAYALFVSVIPSIVFFVSLFGLLGQQYDFYATAIYFIERFSPKHAHILLKTLLDTVISGSSEGLTVVGFLGALWATSQGAAILNKGMIRAFRTCPWIMPFWYGPALSVAIVCTMGGMLILAVNLILFGNLLIEWLKATLADPWNRPQLLESIRWLFIVVGILFFSTVTYAIMLRPWVKRFDWRAALPGALTFVVLWISVSSLFGLYVERLGKYNPIYGALGLFVLFVIWLYFSSITALLGVEVIASNVMGEKIKK